MMFTDTETNLILLAIKEKQRLAQNHFNNNWFVMTETEKQESRETIAQYNGILEKLEKGV